MAQAAGEYPQLEFTMSEVRRVGERLAGRIDWSEETTSDIRRIFGVANSFRASHALPMQLARNELIGRMARMKVKGTTAARLKRMASIRRKLASSTGKLNTIADIAGCRAILPTMADVRTLLEAYEVEGRFEVTDKRDYIATPKADGYRCHHLLLKFKGGEGQEPFKGRKVELQVRSRLQHSWATAVEAVSTFRGEDMKAGIGDAGWLRLFALMSAELAVAEGCPDPDWAPSRVERVRELKDLNRQLRAAETLENIRHAVQGTEQVWQGPNYRAEYFLIRYDYNTKQVEVQPFSGILDGARSYGEAEELDNTAQRPRFNTVLVQADRILDLKEAYPNYFGDVQVFETNLRKIVKGKGAVEFTQPPKSYLPRPPKEVADYSWARRTGARNPARIATAKSGRSPRRPG